jgi:periplasmic protein TonB
VHRPQAIYFPDPDMTAQARKAKYQGTTVLGIVVDRNGNVSRVRVERVLGMGLDASAVRTAKTWRFNPGSRDGHPVAVALNAEVSFRLY